MMESIDIHVIRPAYLKARGIIELTTYSDVTRRVERQVVEQISTRKRDLVWEHFLEVG